MFVVFLVIKNAFRHKLRTTLTIVGIVVAITAFGLLRTIVEAWYAGAEATSSARLVTRNAISLVFSLPLTYAQKIRQVPGVSAVSWANWFGGVYITERNFFPQFAIDGPTYLDMYPEFVIKPEEKKAFLVDRKGAVVGRKLADQYGWKLGDQIPLRGTIFPGTWTFTLRAIYDGVDAKTDETQFYFHWEYLNETIKAKYPRRGDQIGVYIVEIRDPSQAAAISQAIDATFKNSLAETLTETEKAFQLGFVAMTEAILVAVQAVSFVVIIIIMAVMANTMAMTARERYGEYATMKALGFAQRLRRAPHLRGVDRHRAGGRRGGHPAHISDRERLRRRDGHAVPGLLRERRDGAHAARRRARRRRRRRGRAGVARGQGAHRRRPALDRVMTTIPLSYVARNLTARKLTTALTAGGMALVVYVFATVLMLAAGLEDTLVATGQEDNVIVIRRGSQTEVQSGVDRPSAAIVESLPDIATGEDGQKLISKEPVVLINLPKRDSGKPSNVVIRGATPAGLVLRPQVKIVEGRMFQPGTSEIIAGRAIADGFRGAALGETLRFAQRDWTVVGVFDAGRTGFNSEIWGDAEQLLQAFRRVAFSAAIFKLADTTRFDAVKEQIESDPRLHAGGQARDEVLRRSVGSAVQVHLLPGHHHLGDLLHRRDHRRDDHDVRERGVAHE